MHSLFRTSLLASSLALAATGSASATAGAGVVDLRGTSPAVPNSLASLHIHFDTQTITWTSTDSLFGAVSFNSVIPQTWNLTAERLTFVYDDGAEVLIGNLLLGEPDRTVVDLVESPSRARYLLKLDPGTFPAASISDVTVNEEAGVADLTLTLDSEPLQPGSVDFSTSTGTAGELDFDGTPGTVNFAAGQQVATLSIPLVNDLRVERVEEFTVSLTGATRATIAGGSATVTIEDVDTTVVNIFDAKVEEPFRPDVVIPVRLSAPSDFPIMLRHDTPEGTATRLIDFLPRSNTLTFTPGQLEFMIFIPIADDSAPEGDEQFSLRLTDLLLGERTSIGRFLSTVTILDNDDTFKAPQVDEIGWQWPNNAVYRPELNHDEYLMTEGTSVLAMNLGHGTPGSTTTVAGIPFTNSGAGGSTVVGNSGPVNWSVLATGGATSDGLGSPGLDDLFYSEIQNDSGPVRLELNGLDPAKRYVVQLFFGDPRDVDAREWEIDSDLGFSGNVGGPLGEYVRRQFGQGPIGGGVLGQPRATRHILTLGLCNRSDFFFENQGWDNKAPSLSGFQIREVTGYPLSPDVVTLQRWGELHWTGSQIVGGTDKGEIFTSPETVNWTAQNSNFVEDILDIDTVFGTLFATTRFGEFLTSTDNAVTWNSIDPPNVPRAAFFGIIDMSTAVILPGEDGNLVSTSDLVNYTPLVSNTTELLASGAWNGTVLVVVGNRGTVLNSTDGVNFTTFQIPGTNNINLGSILWDGSQFVCTGRVRGSTGGGVVFTSPDGATWTQTAFMPRDPLTQLLYNGFLYMVGSRNGSLYTSPDAINWTEQLPVPNDGVRTIIWTGIRYVAGLQNGDFMWSFDGITWSSETNVPAPPPAFASGTAASWAAAEGMQTSDLIRDLNGDGFAELFNYAMGVSADKHITRDLPGLLPSVDREFVTGRATLVFQFPEFLPADVRLEIEKSTDGENWSVIASRRGTAEWNTAPENVLLQDAPAGGYHLTRLTAAGTYSEQPVVLFRLRATLVP